eukprot:TRINITY_DN31589_c0_g1_i1.p1 TRINITY_DN31589_c0_g1~~TRINITY_DN31589_c0_g1_i1.p1  ORF type:complete len:455 (-),score=142.24 TRINITY_DN31589_c0_g1_i1:1390-2754(-)
MNNLKTAKFLEDQFKVMIENAFFSCNPPPRVVVARIAMPLLHEYIRKLIYSDLQHKTVDIVTEKLLRLPWDEECLGYLRTTFFEIYNVDYSNISAVAQVISKVNKHHTIGVMLVDDVVEEIRYGMELNNFMDCQQRISYVKFLGELYNFGVADHLTVLGVLYQLILFGFEWSKAGVLESKIDSPRDSFRIRLVASLLEGCGRFFAKKKKLDTFLVYFQRYIFLKEVIPVDVEFVVDDLFDTLRPRMDRFRNLTLCQQKINELEQGGEEEVDEKENVDFESKQREAVEEEASDDDVDEEEEEEEVEPHYDWTSRGLTQRAKGNTEEDEDFLKLLDKTFVEDVEARKYESKAVKNLVDADTLAIQALSKQSRVMGGGPTTPHLGSVAASLKSEERSVSVQLLTKKNKNVVSRQIVVPAEEKLVEKMQHKDQTHEDEKKLMKRLVVAGIERTTKDSE